MTFSLFRLKNRQRTGICTPFRLADRHPHINRPILRRQPNSGVEREEGWGYGPHRGRGRGCVMKKLASAAVIFLGLAGSAAFAADITVKAPPAAPAAPATPPWDIAFGGALMTDYEFRGITQSNHKPSVAAYGELRYNVNPNLQLYYGNAGESIDFPNHAAAEIDFYGGIRPTIGKLALDFGFWYYYYPGGIDFNGLGPPTPPSFPPVSILPNTSCANLVIVSGPFGTGCNVSKSNLSFYEGYGKATYNVTDALAITADIYGSPSWLNSGAYGVFASGIVKWTAPSAWFPKDWGAYFQGEGGYYWFGTTDSFYATPDFPAGIKYPNYATWNLGIGITWKVFTLDLRYWDTNLSQGDCAVLTSSHTATLGGAFSPTNPAGLVSNWCGAWFVAKLSADLTLNTNVK
jgi:hypothetical protein